jgi:hypothetical protein
MRHASHSYTHAGVHGHARFLRSVYPRDTAKSVSRDTGLSVRTIEKLLCRESAPSWATTAALMLAYGPDYLAAVLPSVPPWLDSNIRNERRKRLEADQARIACELQDL